MTVQGVELLGVGNQVHGLHEPVRLGEVKQVLFVNLPLLAALLAVIAIRVGDL